jgi:hypothetical protein
MSSETERMINQSNEVYTAFKHIPYALINAEIEGAAKDVLAELTEITKYYTIYKQGMKFQTEGTLGDYVPAQLKHKLSASLINKEARFLFAEVPDIVINPKGDIGKVSKTNEDIITTMNSIIKTILDENKFEDILLKAAKDCFIGKRVAGIVNFNEANGVTITFVPSTQFIYETAIGNVNDITKFVCFIVVKESITLSEKRIFKKKYTKENGIVYLEEAMYDGAGKVIEGESTIPKQPIKLKTIPAIVFVNDGLSQEVLGESEIELLKGSEEWYSKLSSADIDAERKSMNPTKYVIDMSSNSTKDLSTSAGSLWDLTSDQNLDKQHPAVGVLEPSMNFSATLKTTLERIKGEVFEQLDVPNINLETMSGQITSGKALKALYWPLITRCKEKMKVWGPGLRGMIDIIIKGALEYPKCIKKYSDIPLVPVAYEIEIVQNLPLPEDEAEEKALDLAEVESKVMSRKSYMQKWRGLTDDEVDKELEQIAKERQLVEDSFMDTSGGLDSTLDTGFDNQDSFVSDSLVDDNKSSDNNQGLNN